MSRRVLLIDSDLAFQGTLTRELARYRMPVATEPEADRALQLAAADPPALIVLAIEEATKKAGFRVFEKCKKGALSKVPIILVTSSVPPESFAKHRHLKVHADEYIDKRTMSTHELVGKIEGLVALGDPVDDLAIPVEDEIPMEIADGDVVLDEVIDNETGEPGELAAAVAKIGTHRPGHRIDPDDDGAGEFDAHEARTVGPHDGLSIDDVVEAETDAAFAALLGDGDGGFGPSMLAHAPEAAREAEAVPEPIPHTVPELEPDPDGQGVVPELIHDGRGRGTTPPPLHGPIPGVISDERDAPAAPLRAATAPPEPAPADDEPAHDEPAQLHAPVPRLDTSPPVAEPDEQTVAQVQSTPMVAELEPGRYESQPAIPIDDDELLSMDDDVPVEVVAEHHEPEPEPAPLPARAPTPAPMSVTPVGSGSNPAIDLGLDAVAQEAQNDQSGAYDRRSLRKIAELERQLAQLKVELERARAAGEAAAKGPGRETQFLNLRESMLAKDKELKQVKADLVARDQDIAEAREKLRQAQHAKATVETKNAELEQRLLDDSGTATQLQASAKTAGAQIAMLQQQLEAAAKAQGAAEAARAHMERDLATERATRVASASEAERLLRTEREQLVARHQDELGSARSEAQTGIELALAQQREELETAHGAAIDEAIEAVRRANATEHQDALAALERTHAGETVSLKADHAGAQSEMRRELGAEVERLRAALAAAESAHQDAFVAAAATHSNALDALASTHRTELANARDELISQHATERVALQQRHANTVDELRAELEHQTASHAAALATATRERDELVDSNEQAQGALHEQHRAAIADLTARHDQDLAKREADRETLADAARRTAESHRAALAEIEAKHAETLEQLNDAAAREVAEARTAAQASKRAADELATRSAAERETADAVNAQALADLDAKHDRALALANGEFLKHKSVADAEHGRALAALHAEAEQARTELVSEHARVLGELTTDRDELRRGLSSARDALKRSESELASAVQSIADRNAELRGHTGAIAERDTRIAELRKEIDSLEAENASYQEQVLRAYQKIKQDEAMVTRAKKAMAIALTVLDDHGNPRET